MNVLRNLVNPLLTWVVTHSELEVLTPEIVQGLVTDVFQNPEKGVFEQQVSSASCTAQA